MAATDSVPPSLHPDEAASLIRQGTGRGVKIAVIDSGIDLTHPDLRRLELADDVAVVEEDGELHTEEGAGATGDTYGHGTAVAGIIHRTAPEARIGSFRVLNARNRSRSEVIREGVRQALDRGYDILNCSFGCEGSVKYVMSYKDWIDEAYLRGVHVVAACNNVNFMKDEWPGYFPSVITVNCARTDSDDLFHLPGTLVKFAARGHDIMVPWLGGQTIKISGSSFAAPHVAGMVARLLSMKPGLSPDSVMDLLRYVARPWSRDLDTGNVWELPELTREILSRGDPERRIDS